MSISIRLNYIWNVTLKCTATLVFILCKWKLRSLCKWADTKFPTITNDSYSEPRGLPQITSLVFQNSKITDIRAFRGARPLTYIQTVRVFWYTTSEVISKRANPQHISLRQLLHRSSFTTVSCATILRVIPGGPPVDLRNRTKFKTDLSSNEVNLSTPSNM